ncbi:MAG TPA: VCBS repeat-containing protein [Verrucomicrobiota bacterium]|nr:hypothetical protein [Verrucomicrobiales bacterium]HRI11550.1 VCBS repeat-containing protein [Verrucomicrobiota bacterium]
MNHTALRDARLAFLGILALVRLTTLALAGPGDWPSYRRDGGLSGFSPLRGSLAQAPREVWHVDLGGALANVESARVEDLTGDGIDDLVRIRADRLICQDLRGKLLWQSDGLSAPKLIDLRDFADDGGRGLLVEDDTGTEVRTWMIDGRTGQKVELARRRNVFGYRHRVSRILSGVRGLQYCYWWDGQDNELTGPIAHGYLWSFEDGVSRPRVRFQVDVQGMIYSAQNLFADMDSDGEVEMAMVSHEQVWIYDLKNGRQKAFGKWEPSIRSYSSAMALLSLTPGSLPSLLMINPHIPGLEVISWDGAKAARTWKVLTGPEENQYQQQVQIREALPDPFLDLNNDGRLEILALITNEHGDGQARLAIFDAITGSRLLDQPGIVILAVDELDGDGIPEVVLQEGTKLCLANWDGHRLNDRWQESGAVAEVVAGASERRLALGSTTGPQVNPVLRRETVGSRAFVLQFGGERWSCRLAPQGKLEKLHRLDETKSLESTAADQLLRDTWNWEGPTLVTRSNRQEVARYTLPTRRTYMAPPSLVGSLDGQKRIIVRDAEGTLFSLAADGTDRRPLVRRSPAFTHADGLYYTHLGSASLCDLDGDGVDELVACTRDEAGEASVVLVDGKGVVKRRIKPPEGTVQFALGPSGSLGEGNGRWFVIRCTRRFDRDTVAAYEGRTGRQLWLRDAYNTQGRTMKFVLHSPAAVYDYDHDGAEDLITLSENFYGVISVRDNRDLVKASDITASLKGHWPAYGTPILLPVRGRPPHVFLSRAYAGIFVADLEGRPVWHYGLSRDTTPRNHGGIADLDGDGQAEIVTAQADGLLRAFSAEPTLEKCAICPPVENAGPGNRAGKIRWTFQVPGPIGPLNHTNQNSDQDFASADLDGDGRVEVLLGGGDGKLYALKEVNGAGTVLWSLDLGRRVGSPILADLDDDGKAEILVPTEDGRVHCLGSSR